MLFLILPTIQIVFGAFRTPEGAINSRTSRACSAEHRSTAAWISIKLSVISALGGCIIGLALAIAVIAAGCLPCCVMPP